jgi:hypothetical protein
VDNLSGCPPPLGQPCGLPTSSTASRTTKAFFLESADRKGAGSEENEEGCKTCPLNTGQSTLLTYTT